MNIRKCIPGSVLKYIALISMFIDHFGVVVLYRGLYLNAYFSGNEIAASRYHAVYTLCRVLGRIAFPLFAFLLTEGFRYTHNRKKYAVRLFLFALLSQYPFYLAFNFPQMNAPLLNVFFTLLIGLFAMWAIESFGNNRYPLALLISALALSVAYHADTDYDAFGVTVILLFYFFRNTRPLSSALSLIVLSSMSVKELASSVSMLLINLYNDKRGRQMKYLFYAFYPLHLLLLYLILIFVFQ